MISGFSRAKVVSLIYADYENETNNEPGTTNQFGSFQLLRYRHLFYHHHENFITAEIHCFRYLKSCII